MTRDGSYSARIMWIGRDEQNGRINKIIPTEEYQALQAAYSAKLAAVKLFTSSSEQTERIGYLYE